MAAPNSPSENMGMDIDDGDNEQTEKQLSLVDDTTMRGNDPCIGDDGPDENGVDHLRQPRTQSAGPMNAEPRSRPKAATLESKQRDEASVNQVIAADHLQSVQEAAAQTSEPNKEQPQDAATRTTPSSNNNSKEKQVATSNFANSEQDPEDRPIGIVDTDHKVQELAGTEPYEEQGTREPVPQNPQPPKNRSSLFDDAEQTATQGAEAGKFEKCRGGSATRNTQGVTKSQQAGGSRTPDQDLDPVHDVKDRNTEGDKGKSKSWLATGTELMSKAAAAVNPLNLLRSKDDEKTSAAQNRTIRKSSRFPETYKRKSVKAWTSEELQGWIESLHLDDVAESIFLSSIEENEVTGEDIADLESDKELQECFEEVDPAAVHKVFDALQKRGKKARKASSGHGHDDDRKQSKQRKTQSASSYAREQQIPWILTDPSSGITGLHNLGNTCFMNCVIQSLLQTPPLVRYLRESLAQRAPSTNRYAQSMLDAFLEVAASATRKSAACKSVSPSSIVYQLRRADSRFKRGAQEDALSAVVKMIELLDTDIIAQKQAESGKKWPDVAGSWIIRGGTKSEELNDKIKTMMLQYNPHKSVVRDEIHFLEETNVRCMEPGCDYTESRYRMVERIVIPMQDNQFTLSVDIHIPSIRKTMKQIPFKLLSYCSIQTLHAQIFEHVLQHEEAAEFRGQLHSFEQIAICGLLPLKNASFSQWIEEYDAAAPCDSLVNREGVNVFAVVEDVKSTKTKMKQKGSFLLTTLNVFVQKDGSVKHESSSMSFERISNKKSKSYKGTEYGKARRFVYFGGQLLRDADAWLPVSRRQNVVICFWVHPKASNLFNMQSDLQALTWHCKVVVYEASKDGDNYKAILKALRRRKAIYQEFEEKKVNEEDQPHFDENCMEPFNTAIATYTALQHNEVTAAKLAYSAFTPFASEVKTNYADGINVKTALGMYYTSNVLNCSCGVVLKCRKCEEKSKVVKQTRRIVRYPSVFILAIDRYRDGRKLNDLVRYPMALKSGGSEYELYAVCHHSGSLRGGHYWADVKSVDHNTWLNANDRSISTMSPHYVQNQSTAIILMYRKRT